MNAHLCKYINFFIKVGIIRLFILFCTPTACAQAISTDYLSYIETYKETAVRQQQEYGIPASITLAQGLLESGAGRSRLATEGNNHFGIKCHSAWKGEGIYHDDDERNECFRKYNDASESFEDHARFLKRKRYAPLFELKVTDYEGWAKGLKKCGYATDPSYASKLINIIELYELNQYDSGQPVIASRKHLEGDESIEHAIDMEIIGEFKLTHKIRRKWGLHYITVYDGDSYESIADEFSMSKRKLLSWNDLPRRAETVAPGTRLYLQEKHEKAQGAAKTHKIKQGETLHQIAQDYGIKLKSLLKRNKLDDDSVIRPGDYLLLQ